jgi:hypothetical protein
MHDDKQMLAAVQVEQDDEWLDEVLSQTFPASDHVPWRHRETQVNETKEEPRAELTQNQTNVNPPSAAST